VVFNFDSLLDMSPGRAEGPPASSMWDGVDRVRDDLGGFFRGAGEFRGVPALGADPPCRDRLTISADDEGRVNAS
jgi:hypothetical protein